MDMVKEVHGDCQTIIKFKKKIAVQKKLTPACKAVKGQMGFNNNQFPFHNLTFISIPSSVSLHRCIKKTDYSVCKGEKGNLWEYDGMQNI